MLVVNWLLARAWQFSAKLTSLLFFIATCCYLHNNFLPFWNIFQLWKVVRPSERSWKWNRVFDKNLASEYYTILYSLFIITSCLNVWTKYDCFESFPFRQHFVIFVRQITWFRWNVKHWTSGVNIHNKNSNRYVPF
jgi:hypothetical protein